ncbi:hypothetical protein ACWCQW_38280 [Streptomyces mirabilis]
MRPLRRVTATTTALGTAAAGLIIAVSRCSAIKNNWTTALQVTGIG